MKKKKKFNYSLIKGAFIIFPRFWYENPSSFTSAQLSQLRRSTLGRVLCDNGDDIDRVTADVFRKPDSEGDLVRCADTARVPRVALQPWFGEYLSTEDNIPPLRILIFLKMNFFCAICKSATNPRLRRRPPVPSSTCGGGTGGRRRRRWRMKEMKNSRQKRTSNFVRVCCLSDHAAYRMPLMLPHCHRCHNFHASI